MRTSVSRAPQISLMMVARAVRSQGSLSLMIRAGVNMMTGRRARKASMAVMKRMPVCRRSMTGWGFKERRSSQNDLMPDVLQAASPMSQFGPKLEDVRPTYSPRSSRYGDSPTVLPERPRPRHQYSVSSMDSDDSASRRFSLPSALQPATETAYKAREPLLSESDYIIGSPHNSSRSQSRSHKARPALPSRFSPTRSVLSGLVSPRSPSTPNRFPWRTANDYAILEESGERGADAKKRRTLSEDFQESEIDNGISYDISSLEGPISMQQFTASRETLADIQAQGSLAAEYHQLEAGGKLTGGLGGGMAVVEKLQFNAMSSGVEIKSSPLAVPGGGVVRGNTIRDVGKREAKKRNEIVAVKGTIYFVGPMNVNSPLIDVTTTVDLSSLSGTDHANGGPTGPGEFLRRATTMGNDKHSYFYPDGK